MRKMEQSLLFSDPKYSAAREYWLQKLGKDPAPVKLLGDLYQAQPRPSGEPVAREYDLPGVLSGQLLEFCQGNDLSLYIFLLAVFKCLFYRYTEKAEIIVGSPVYTEYRAPETLNDLTPIKDEIQADMTFKEFLLITKNTVIEAYENQDFPVDLLVEAPDDIGEKARLFDIVCSLDAIHSTMSHPQDNPGLWIAFHRKETALKVRFQYDAAVLDENLLQALEQHYLNLCNQVFQDIDCKITELEFLSAAEKQRLIVDFNQTTVDYPASRTIHQLFEEQAARTPDQPAVNFQDRTLSYRELNEKSNQLARILRDKGVKPDGIVGILAERSLEMMIGIMGVSKAGGAYLPISPDYPQERIRFMLEDTDAKVLLTQGLFAGKAGPGFEILCLEDEDLYTGNGGNPEKINQPSDLAYIIYTSGSTGKPKGVMIEHHSLVNRLNWMQKAYPIGRGDWILQKTPYTFDVSVWELFWWSMTGAGVCFLIPGGEKDPEAIVEAIEAKGITTMHFVPSMLAAFLGYLEMGTNLARLRSLQQVFASGEALNLPQVDKFNQLLYQANGTRLINLYGPTEATVDVSYFDCSTRTADGEGPSHSPGIIPIGKPIDNIRLHIFNQTGQLQPPSIPGELYIAGVGVARGYLNRPEMTAEKFVELLHVENRERQLHVENQKEQSHVESCMLNADLQQPSTFNSRHGALASKDAHQPSTRFYRTGDLARWLPDGNIEFRGRIDDQVKIRGLRIELGEIESQLARHPLVKEAVILAKEDRQGNKYLCAYFTAVQKMDPKTLKSYLADILPEYMIPVGWVQLAQMPLMPNGKLNKRALPEPEIKATATSEFIGPTDAMEEKLAQIWREVLEIETPSMADSFFELGGNSLKVMTLISRIHQVFQIQVPFRVVFQGKTLQEVAGYIRKQEKDLTPRITPAEIQPYYPQSSAQKRLFVVTQFENAQIGYNIPGATIIEGKLDVSRLEKAFQSLIKRHEPLRTSFEFIDGQPVQLIHPWVDFELELFQPDLAGAETGAPIPNEQSDELIRRFLKPFDLSKAPLLRAGLIEWSTDQNILLYDIHHMIADGISLETIIKELFGLYEGRRPPELPIQFKDYAVWQNEFLKSEVLNQQREFWRQRFSDELPVLNLPADYPRPALQSFEGDAVSSGISRELTAQIVRLASETGTTLFMFLLAAFNLLLAKYTGQEDIILGTAAAGRTHPDLENMVGMFVNTLALRNYPVPQKTFREFLAEVKESSIQAFENQDYQFEELVKDLDLTRDMSRNPLFDVMFLLQDTAAAEKMAIPGLQLRPYDFNYQIAKFDLRLTIVKTAADMFFSVEYCAKLFTRKTIERMLRRFSNLLSQVASNPDMHLAEVKLITPEERDDILDDYNRTAAHFPGPQTLTGLLDAQLKQTPELTAIMMADQEFTYQELHQKSNQVANYLKASGLGRGNLIGLMAKRSLNTIINLLGILKAGAAYVPVDPEYPEERRKFILENSNCGLLLEPDLPDTLAEYSAQDLPLVSEPDDIAYVIYTSGSTGQPKGVVITHRAVVNTIIDINQKFKINATDRIIGLSSLCFDLSVYDVFGALSTGAALVVIPDQRDAKAIADTLANARVTVWNSVPAIMELLVANIAPDYRNPDLRITMLSGDWIPLNLPEKIGRYFPATQIISLGGATEASIWSIYYPIQEVKAEWKSIPYGRPLANQRFFVLDGNGMLCPMGIPGELYIGGVGLAKGYMNNEAKTRTAFIQHPELGDLYKTGDYGILHEEGYIEFLGRLDTQVKIRGYRVELGEIETRLLKHDAVEAALVIAKEASNKGGGFAGSKYLCAYFVANRDLTLQELRDYLTDFLPDYMIPSYFVPLEQLPLTPNGKVDRKRLPEPLDMVQTGAEYEAPRNEIERRLVQIWQEVFDLERIGIHDNFFDLGGHSLTALKIIEKAEQQALKISLGELFTLRTIAQIAANITGNDQPDFNNDSLSQPAVEAADGNPNPYRRLFNQNFYHLKDSQPFEVDRAEAKSLRIILQNEITGYLCHGLPLCIILTDQRLIPWYYEHFIDLFAIRDERDYLKLEFLEYRAAYKEVMYEVYLGYQLLKNESNIVEFIIDKINLGYYVIINIDEYYLPVKVFYQKEHFVHPSMIYGYDNQAQTFMAIGFDREQIFTRISFEYGALAEAYEQGKLHYRETAPWAENNVIELLKLKDYPEEYPFNIKRFIAKLDNYLSAAGDDSVIFTYMMDKTKVVYGVDVYQEIINRLQNLMEGRVTIGYQAIHIFYEHKKSIYARLQYILSRYPVSGALANLIENYSQIVEQAELIRRTYLELSYSSGSANESELINGLQGMIAAIHSLQTSEQKLLNDICHQIRLELLS